MSAPAPPAPPASPMVGCDHCGAPIGAFSIRCSHCGVPLAAPHADGRIRRFLLTMDDLYESSLVEVPEGWAITCFALGAGLLVGVLLGATEAVPEEVAALVGLLIPCALLPVLHLMARGARARFFEALYADACAPAIERYLRDTAVPPARLIEVARVVLSPSSRLRSRLLGAAR